MGYFQLLQRYFDIAKIDYYTGSIKGLQKLILQTTGELIPICTIREYLTLAVQFEHIFRTWKIE